MSSLIHLTFTILFIYFGCCCYCWVFVFFSISVSPASCLQPRHTGRGCSQALLALLSNWPIRGSRSDHHSLPLLSPFCALHHHPLHLPAKVRHTGRSRPHQLSVHACRVMSHLHQQDVASELEKYFLVAKNSQFNVSARQSQDVPCCVTEAKHTGRSVFPSVQLILVTVDPVPFFIPCSLFTSEFQLHVWPSWCSKQVKKHHSSAQAGNYHLALDAACGDSLPMKRKTVSETLWPSPAYCSQAPVQK